MVHVERDNWRVFIPLPIRVLGVIVVTFLLHIAFAGVDLLDPRVP